jgi:cytochrome c-type biogenesis protein CcmH/NrfG
VQRVIIGSATILLGLVLLSLAVPRAIAHLLLLPGTVAFANALNGQLLSTQAYKRAFDSADAALGWVELPELRKSLGGVLYYRAQSADVLNLDVPATLEEARKELERGLAEEPADSAPWAWLSDIRRFQGDPDGASKALRLSILSAPRDVNLAPLRAGIALALWSHLDPDTRGLADADVRRALGTKAGGSFVRRVRDSGLLPPLRRTVAADPVANASLWLLLRHDRSAG